MRKTLGLALGSGGARGIAHIGFLQALEEAGIRPDYVTGCSMGAIVGACYCAGLPLETLREVALSLKLSKIATLNINPIRANGLLRFNKARQLLEQYLGDITFADLRIPFSCIAVDLAAGKVVELKEGNVINTATDVGTAAASTVMNTFLGLVVAVYVLAQKERIGRFTRRCIDAFLPKRASSAISRVASMASETFSSFVAGQLADSCILGILCYICMLIFRFPYPEVISVVIGVTSLVPMVGSFIGEVIGALLILIVSPLKALLFVIMVLAIQQVDGAFIYPRIVGKSVGLPGVAVFCAVIVGGNIAGVLGAVMGVPVCAVLYALLKEAVASRLEGRRTDKPLV